MNKGWGAGLLTLLLAGFASPGFAGGPCTCKDVPALQARLAQRLRLAAAANQVVAESAKKWFPTAGWAKERFIQIAFPDKPPTVEGVQDYGQPPRITEELKKENCEAIWKATQAHEDDHAAFDKTISDSRYPWIMIGGQEGGTVLAPKEARGYAVEVAYLTKELERLAKECDSKQAMSEPERYQENDQAQRAEQKARVAHAAARVAAYASGIK